MNKQKWKNNQLTNRNEEIVKDQTQTEIIINDQAQNTHNEQTQCSKYQWTKRLKAQWTSTIKESSMEKMK